MELLAVALLSGLLLFTGCQKREDEAKAPAAQDPPAQNVVTDYVDRGIRTMDRAQEAADALNARTAQQNQSAVSADAP